MRAPHQPPHRDAQRLAREIPQGELDPGDRLLGRAVGGLARVAVHVDVVLLDGGRVLADEAHAKVLHEADEPARDPIAAELAVAGQALVGADGAEQPRPRRLEPGADGERLDRGDLHDVDDRAVRSRTQRWGSASASTGVKAAGSQRSANLAQQSVLAATLFVCGYTSTAQAGTHRRESRSPLNLITNDAGASQAFRLTTRAAQG
jgi:hypothetical protein